MSDTPPSITCPKCSMVSYNPNDIKHKYCGNCRMFYGDPATLVDRKGKPIDALTWGALWEDLSYRVVAHDFAVPTPWEVKTVWEGIPSSCMFAVGIRRGNATDWTTMVEPRTEAEAVDHHVRVCNLLRDQAKTKLEEFTWD